MQDLRKYSNNELSLIVFNTHDLYTKLMSYSDNKFNQRNQFNFYQFLNDNHIIYNGNQWDYFASDVKSYFNELNSNK
tara:strand:+ start:126 stop:356 length:231 start_codon:yes stop_codon:yes gene_type:complete